MRLLGAFALFSLFQVAWSVVCVPYSAFLAEFGNVIFSLTGSSDCMHLRPASAGLQLDIQPTQATRHEMGSLDEASLESKRDIDPKVYAQLEGLGVEPASPATSSIVNRKATYAVSSYFLGYLPTIVLLSVSLVLRPSKGRAQNAFLFALLVIYGFVALRLLLSGLTHWAITLENPAVNSTWQDYTSSSWWNQPLLIAYDVLVIEPVSYTAVPILCWGVVLALRGGLRVRSAPAAA